MAFDKLTQGVDKLKGKVGGVVGSNREKINQGIDKTGEFIKGRTGNKHDDKVTKGEAKLRQGLDALSNQGKKPGPDAGPAGPDAGPGTGPTRPDTGPDAGPAGPGNGPAA